MAIPKYNELYMPVLHMMEDKGIHNVSELTKLFTDNSNLTEIEKNATLPSGGLLIKDRISWAVTYLKKAGLVEAVGHGKCTITDEGLKAIHSGVIIDNAYLTRYSSFVEFYGRGKSVTTQTTDISTGVNDDMSPQERIAEAMKELNSALADSLTDEIMKISPYDFEKLIIKLLLAMGYGSKELNSDAVTRKSGDEGIDGILKADKFGFDSIYIQAKQWDRKSVVGRPEIQKFAGAMMGQGANKGLFITTTRFSNEAQDYARKNLSSKIVLVDGERLAQLMIEYDIGVSTVETHKVKRVDTDFFADID